MKRTVAALVAAIIPLLANVPSVSADSTTVISGVEVDPNDPAWPEYLWQREHGAPGIRYWTRVAQCETRQNWQNTGRWAGGLGIFTQRKFPEKGMGTWERWGGEQFAPRPDKATPLQQIVVANRIAMFGWQAKFRRWDGRQQRVRLKHYVKYHTGFNGWGCIKHNRTHQRSINPARYERRREAFRKNRPIYQVFEITLTNLGVPKWATVRLPPRLLK